MKCHVIKTAAGSPQDRRTCLRWRPPPWARWPGDSCGRVLSGPGDAARVTAWRSPVHRVSWPHDNPVGSAVPRVRDSCPPTRRRSAAPCRRRPLQPERARAEGCEGGVPEHHNAGRSCGRREVPRDRVLTRQTPEAKHKRAAARMTVRGRLSCWRFFGFGVLEPEVLGGPRLAGPPRPPQSCPAGRREAPARTPARTRTALTLSACRM